MLKRLKPTHYVLGAIVLVHLFILSRLIFYPYPELFIYTYLTQKGLLPYAQIFDQHFPGLLFLPINLASLGMTTPQIARYWHWGIIASTHVLLFITTSKFLKSKNKALLANLLYLIWQPALEGHVLWIDTFIPLFLLPAFYFLLNWGKSRESKHLFLTGIFLGVSFIFKQVTAPLILFIGIYILFKTKSISKTLPLVVGVSILPIIVFSYLFLLGVWKDFYFWTYSFNVTTFAEMGRKLPDFSGLVITMPLFGTALLVLLGYLKKNKELFTLALFLIGALFFAYARFDYVHLQPALPFAIMVTAWVAKKINSRKFELFLTAIFLFVVIAPIRVNIGSRTPFFGDFENKLVQEVGHYAKENDSVFAMGTTMHLYQLTNTLPPGKVFVFQFPWFMVRAENKVLSGIINDPPKVVVRDKGASTGGLNLVSYMPKINDHIEKYYHTVKMIGSTEIMLPN